MNNDKIAAVCGDCAEALGTNSDCGVCVEWLVKAGAAEVDAERANSVLDQASEWMKSHVGVGPEHFFKQVGLLYEMLRDAITGKYSVPWTTVAVLVATLAYVISPFDLIPDFIPLIGWGDDAAVVVMAARVIQSDLQAYAFWRGLDLTEYGFEAVAGES